MSKRDFNARDGKTVVVLGSLNMDLVMRTPRVPVGGETINGHQFSTVAGGKVITRTSLIFDRFFSAF